VRTLVPPDEGRYAEMAREMFATGDWITTRLNGIKYFEKPPLQTWMNALSFAAFGLGEWQARLWTGLCGLGGVLLTAMPAPACSAPRGLLRRAGAGSSLFWVASGQIDSLDMGLSGMMTIALLACWWPSATATASEQRNWMLVLGRHGAGRAGQGPDRHRAAGRRAGAVLAAVARLRHLEALHLGKGLLLFFAIATPWFVLVGLRNPEQPHFFFVHEHWERFFLKTHHREGAWYYFLVLLTGHPAVAGRAAASIAAAAKRQDGASSPAAAADLGRVHLLLLQLFQLQAARLHPAHLPGAGPADRPLPGTATPPAACWPPACWCVGAAGLIGGRLPVGMASARSGRPARPGRLPAVGAGGRHHRRAGGAWPCCMRAICAAT
jgi:4-amino-4-deoxy-L-arabinose transferase-like glycosyltransferase